MAIFNPGSGFGSAPDPTSWANAQAAIAAMKEAAGGASFMLWPEAGQIGAYAAPLNGDPVIYEKLSELATTTRASKAWHPSWDFVSGSQVGPLIEFANDVPVIGPRGLLATNSVENLLSNPRGEGAAAPATPTGWSKSSANVTIVGRGTQDGWPYVDVSLDGVLAGAEYITPMSAVTAAAGETFTGSVGVAIVSGSATVLPNLNVNGAGGGAAVSIPIAVDRTHRRWSATATLAGAVTSSRVLVVFPAGTYAAATYRIFAPSFTKTTRAVPLVMPPVGTPGASVQAAQVLRWPTGGWYRHSAGTLVIEALMPPASSLVNGGGIVSFSAATPTDGRGIEVTAAGGICGRVRQGGTLLNSPNAPVVTPGSRVLAALSWTETASRFAANGVAGADFAGALTVPAATLMLLDGASSLSVANAAHAPVERCRFFPWTMTADELAAITRPYWS